MIELKSFRIKHCFGFEDSSDVMIKTPTGFVYLLGRNSSGKTSFLQALHHFELGLTPGDYKNFGNFDNSDQEPILKAHFVGVTSKLSSKLLREYVAGQLRSQGISEADQGGRPVIVKLLDLVEETYGDLFQELSSQNEVWVEKNRDGEYAFLADVDDRSHFSARRQQIRSTLGSAFPQGVFTSTNGQKKNVSYSFEEIEAGAFRQFPAILFFGDAHPLSEDLPDRINEPNLGRDQNPLVKEFIKLLGEESLRRFFVANDPDEREQLLAQFKQAAFALSRRVNASSGDVGATSLVEMRLHENNGLQITMSVDGKKSFYRHMSDNTKSLVAYHIYTQSEESRGQILLFDEPNVGFHPTAQAFLLNFLRHLAGQGNQVIVSTHSEYMIDLDLLGGVRLLATSREKNPVVRNHPYHRARGAGDFLALQPILDAIGLRYGSQLNLDSEAVLTEGVTDLMYIRAFARMLGVKRLGLAPTRSDAHIKTLIPFFISQGIGLRIVIDKGRVKAKIQEVYEVPDRFIFEVPVPAPFEGAFRRSGIEDLFTKDDFRGLLERAEIKFVEEAFSRQPNSAFMKNHPGKRILAHGFLENPPSSTDLDEETVENFRALVEFCQGPEWFRL